jgi:ABC-type amino acid transport substrate-binding protein
MAVRRRRSLVALAVPALAWITTGVGAAQEIRPTLDKIRETGGIDLGYRETSPPFSFLDKDGKPAGYSVDLCQRIVGALRRSLKLPELKVKWVPLTPASRIANLVRGTIDLGCESATITFLRMEQVAFSHMIFVDGSSLLATAASGVAGVRDLSGKRVGVIAHSTTQQALADALTRQGIQARVITVTEHGEGLQDLEAGALDAYASDRMLLAGLLGRAKKPDGLRLSREYYSYEPYGLMLRRGDNAFQAQVNRALSALYRSEQIVPIYERWFGPFAAASPLVQALYRLHSWPE